LKAKAEEMRKTKYASSAIAIILRLIKLVRILQLQTLSAQTDNLDRNRMLVEVGPIGVGVLGHPFLGYALHR
jgi:hypothetical protein